MKLQGKTKNDSTVKLGIWGADGSSQPRQAIKATDVSEVNINGKKTSVYKNTSKGGTKYAYVQVDGVWYWTRDDFSVDTAFVDYKKPEPAAKPEAKAKDAKPAAKTDAKSSAKTESKTAPKTEAAKSAPKQAAPAKA